MVASSTYKQTTLKSLDVVNYELKQSNDIAKGRDGIFAASHLSDC